MATKKSVVVLRQQAAAAIVSKMRIHEIVGFGEEAMIVNTMRPATAIDLRDAARALDHEIGRLRLDTEF